MRKLLLLLTCNLFFSESYSQSNCSNPTRVTICPSVYLSNQTNAGMGDNAPSTCNIIGNDVVYELYAPSGARVIYVSVVNASASLRLILQNTCGSATCTSRTVFSGTTNVSFNVTYSNYYYVWVDASTTVTYGISFGADTGSTYINIPNTQGNLRLDSSGCGSPFFNSAKPFFQVSYNNVFKTNPMTLSPLNVPGTMCVTTFFRNTTGVEGIKKFQFKFNPLAFASVLAVSPVAGQYNAGSWVASASGGIWSFNFVDSLGTGRGDFTGSPDTCLKYTFCFTLTPLSNDPMLTNIQMNASSDGFGSGFTGYVSKGCCPANYFCLSNGGYATAGAHTFGFAFADPGTGLPIVLLNFDAKPIEHYVHLSWITESEINNDYFTVEKSQNGDDWITIDKITGAGTSTTMHTYETIDERPFQGTSFYRLKQTDYDGHFTYFNTVSVFIKEFFEINLFPVPVNDNLVITIKDYRKGVEINIVDVTGSVVLSLFANKGSDAEINTSSLEEGVYLTRILSEDFIETKKLIVAR